MRLGSLVHIALAGLGACSAPATPAAPPPSPDAPPATVASAPPATAHPVAGTWVFHQPAHAEYEATLYEVTAAGGVTELGSVSSGCHAVPVGHVSLLDAGCSGDGCPERARCEVGGRWASAADGGVAIEGNCSDGTPRWLEFRLDGDHLQFAGVRGESGWRHLGWDWLIERCQTRRACEEKLAGVPRRRCR